MCMQPCSCWLVRQQRYHVFVGILHDSAEWLPTHHFCDCRWNATQHSAGTVHLELLPMLLGFFTYKAGVLGRGTFELLRRSSEHSRNPQEEAADLAGQILFCPSQTLCRPVDACAFNHMCARVHVLIAPLLKALQQCWWASSCRRGL